MILNMYLTSELTRSNSDCFGGCASNGILDAYLPQVGMIL